MIEERRFGEKTRWMKRKEKNNRMKKKLRGKVKDRAAGVVWIINSCEGLC